MLQDVKWSESRSYKTGKPNEPLEFYLNALNSSVEFDLLLGYFSSSAIQLLSVGFAKFLGSGGKVRMLINHILSKEDKDAVTKGLSGNVSNAYDLSNIAELKKSLDEYGIHFFECLAWLIANKKIDLKIIKPRRGKGISHYKSGVFSDGTSKVGFNGSCNFTAYGFLENLEEIKVYLDWENERSKMDIEYQVEQFNEIFEGRSDLVQFVDVSDVEIAIRNEFGNKDINQLLINEQELLAKKKNVYKNKHLKEVLNTVEESITRYTTAPRFPYPEGPREYQKEAYQRWVANDYKGIFAMATGTGKTITSLNCVLNELKNSIDQSYHAIILVPTITLVEQWEIEAKRFNFQEIIKISSKHQWESELAKRLSIAKRIPTSFIIITTYASFVKDKFHKQIPNLPSDTILIADEAHNLGSPTVLKSLSDFSLQKRIGLSATPKRAYDPIGSRAMEGFFNDKEPYTYTFSMERAIEEGILCKYYYYPHVVNLTSEELTEYMEITKKLSKFFNIGSGSLDDSSIVQMLLLKRKRIIHKAVNKLPTTKQILEDRFNVQGSLKYTFIYVPEGVTPDVSEDDSTDEETIKIINQYTREIGRIDKSIMVNQFISGMADRNDVLNQFKEGKIHVIASMKCLDEGVDIPRAEYAIFCSSTGNPRQFIQRRGRILRTHPKKDIAVIHDLIVIPDLTTSQPDSGTFRVERSLVEKELERVMYFASLAINPYETESVFDEVCQHYNLNIYTIHNKFKNND